MVGIPVKAYSPRGKLRVFLRTQDAYMFTCYEDSNTVCPPPVLHQSELERMPRPLERTYAQASK
jgi:hypothetical protein